jgi:hypothetical protein
MPFMFCTPSVFCSLPHYCPSGKANNEKKKIWYNLIVMKINNAGAIFSRFIILIPGRDTEKLLYEYRTALFAKGFHGAYSFPLAAPLAELSRPFSRDELKKLAVNIRKLTMAHDGKISGTESGTSGGFGKLSFFGPHLDLPIINEELLSETAKGKIARTFFPLVLCASIFDSGSYSAGVDPQAEKCPTLSFRAAALANIAIRSLNGGSGEALPYSFEWETGPLVWLPSYKKAGSGK